MMDCFNCSFSILHFRQIHEKSKLHDIKFYHLYLFFFVRELWFRLLRFMVVYQKVIGGTGKKVLNALIVWYRQKIWIEKIRCYIRIRALISHSVSLSYTLQVLIKLEWHKFNVNAMTLTKNNLILICINVVLVKNLLKKF